MPNTPNAVEMGPAAWVHLMRLLAARDPVRLPANRGLRHVALGKIGMARGHHVTDGAADHDLVELDAGRVGSAGIHATAHIRIHR